MRYVNNLLLSDQANQALTSSAQDLSNIFKLSAQVVCDGTATGSVQLQVSNDLALNNNNVFSNVVFTNWANLGSSVAVSGAGNSMVAAADMSYRAIRAVYTSTFLNITSITAVADVSGSLNSKYLLASSRVANYYIWFSNGTGVDPAIAGRTAIPVVYADNDSAATIGGLIRTACAGKGWTVTGSNAQAILTNATAGLSLAPADGAAPTGFTLAFTEPQGNVSVQIMALGY